MPMIRISHTSVKTCLLDNFFTNTVMKYISPEYLFLGIKILGFAILLIVVVIYAYLYYKKRVFLYNGGVSKNLQVWISAIIMEDSFESVVLPRKFYRMMKNPWARKLVMEELLACKRNFSGVAADNIVALYEHLGLKADSIKKMHSKRSWHIRAKGIQEIYMMDQRDMLPDLYKSTNSENEYVRMEAQTGVINLTGFAGLRFLDIITYPLTGWQQIKLLEQLKHSSQKEDLSDRIPFWLLSENNTVVVFALKLAGEYQQFGLRENVINCLNHPSVSVRNQAFKTLERLTDETIPALLMAHLPNESLANQLGILDSLKDQESENEKPQLIQLLEHSNDQIKLKTAIIIANNYADGWEILEQKANEIPAPYQPILFHVQSVLKR